VRGRTVVLIALLSSVGLRAEPIRVRHAEGVVHGFLSLRTVDGTLVADGDLIQTVSGNRVTTRLAFHFKDGSIWDETALYSQRGTFRLLTDTWCRKARRSRSLWT
jgi:hypothetical protein